ncbi:MAG: hypothetical protein Q9P01_06920 [Anaerolineae bacterium]|nr:hypothetical protein [Anaerolineae bacterium]MDQ7034561.1 hypothetical protein [Anaerolineae bacterium]
MTDNNLPTIEPDNTEDTVASDPQRTRPHPVRRDDDTQQISDTVPIQRPTRQQAPPQGGHVQPIRGQPQQRAPRTGYPPRPRRQKSSASDSGLYLPWWSLALMLVGVLVVSFGLVGVVYLFRNSEGIFAEPTPIIRIITAVPTHLPQANQATALAPSTQIIAGGSTTGDLALTGPTLAAVQLTATPAPITLNSRVAVDGVATDKLNVRDSAAVNGTTVLFRADETEQFIVIEGPLQGDGFTWWRIQDPLDSTRTGWAVSNYLAVVPQQ